MLPLYHPIQLPLFPVTELTCAVCGKPFKVFPARIRAAQKRGTYPKYCSKPCANIGQAENRIIWNKGKTKETDERLQRMGEASQRYRQEHPELYSGDNHWTRKRPVSPETLAHLERIRALRPPPTPAQLQGLQGGRTYFKGRTKENDPIVAARTVKVADAQRGVKKPTLSEWRKRYYDEYPEKHPNFLMASKGHETSIERIMRLALEAENITFQPQYHVGRYFIDFAILSHHLAIEVDGAHWHNQERDAQRDKALAALGWQVIRFSESRVKQEIHLCISEIRDLLA